MNNEERCEAEFIQTIEAPNKDTWWAFLTSKSHGPRLYPNPMPRVMTPWGAADVLYMMEDGTLGVRVDGEYIQQEVTHLEFLPEIQRALNSFKGVL